MQKDSKTLPRMTLRSDSYVPALPPKPTMESLAYSKHLALAPYSALRGVVSNARPPERFIETPRCRVRNQVGLTNRWRIPDPLYSDLLGSSQALKAVQSPFNQTLVSIITAESPHLSTNLDLNKPYSFRRQNDRPFSVPSFQPCVSQPRPRGTATRGEIPSASCSSSATSGFGSSTDGDVPPPSQPASRPRNQPPSRSNQPQPLSRSKTMPVGPVKSFTPKNARPKTPIDIFLYHSKKSTSFMGPVESTPLPDVLLKCCGMDWELHRPYLQKAERLAALLQAAENPRVERYYRSPASQTLDNYIRRSNFYSSEYQDISARLSQVEKAEEPELKEISHPAHTSQPRVSSVTVVTLDIDDPLITQRAMAVALGNLYHEGLDVDVEDVAGVLAAASCLSFKQLVEGCCEMMLKTINCRTVCKYYDAASRYNQDKVSEACERWLELNLIPKLSTQVQLREIGMELLQKVIKSSRLFVVDEYSVFRTLAYWLFLQLNPDIQLMPSHSTVLAFFNSLPKGTAFLERDEGQLFKPLFSAVRLHGIADTNHVQDLQIMNVLPQAAVIDLLSQHYHSLQGGGDMSSSLRNFSAEAIRQGFIVDDEPHYHSEILSLHGFHFELKAVKQKVSGAYTFFMQRLKPGDPILSFRQCERHTFSMRPDREVRYSITVQHADLQQPQHSTGVLTHKFGLGEKSSRSEVLQLTDLKKPIYVSFAVLFPAS